MTTPSTTPSTTLVDHDVAARAGERLGAARRAPRVRLAKVTAGLAALWVLVFAARVLLGDFHITIPDFWRIVVLDEQIPGATFILMETKLPRAVLGTLVGAAFGVAGVLFQATLRNPLASPDIVGVSMGASASAVFAIVVLDLDGAQLSVAAVLGAIVVSAITRWTAGGTGQKLVLVGVGMAAVLASVVQYLFTRADVWDAQLVLRWLGGSLSQVDWATLRWLTLVLVPLLALVVWVSRDLRAAELGPDTAAGLGVSRHRTDLTLALGVTLVGVGVAAAGPIAFVAFVAGPVTRALNGGRASLVAGGLVGAVMTVGADYVADYLIFDTNLPVGVVTGAAGAPFLIWLLASNRSGRRTA